MAYINLKNIEAAMQKFNILSHNQKEDICDDIYLKQPNLLASILVQSRMGSTFEEIEILLNILMTTHIALVESGIKLKVISEKVQEHQLQIYLSTVKFSENMNHSLVNESINQFVENHSEKVLLAYIITEMNRANFPFIKKESSKYLMVTGINLANCIAVAKLA